MENEPSDYHPSEIAFWWVQLDRLNFNSLLDFLFRIDFVLQVLFVLLIKVGIKIPYRVWRTLLIEQKISSNDVQDGWDISEVGTNYFVST